MLRPLPLFGCAYLGYARSICTPFSGPWGPFPTGGSGPRGHSRRTKKRTNRPQQQDKAKGRSSLRVVDLLLMPFLSSTDEKEYSSNVQWRQRERDAPRRSLSRSAGRRWEPTSNIDHRITCTWALPGTGTRRVLLQPCTTSGDETRREGVLAVGRSQLSSPLTIESLLALCTLWRNPLTRSGI